MKKFINIFVIALALATVIWLGATKAEAAVTENGTCGDNLTWTLDDQGTLVISGTGEMTEFKSADGEYWGPYGSKIKTVIIEDGVTSILEYTFYYCTDIQSVTIGNSVTTIGGCAFGGCTGLKSLIIPDSVKTIGAMAFWECTGLETVVLGNGVNEIGENAFWDCTGLKAIELPDSLVTIESCAFHNCTSLTKLTIPKSVTSLGKYLFLGCTGLKEIYVEPANPNYSSDARGVIFNKDKTELVQAYHALSGTYEIPASVITISKYAFEGCVNLTAVTIPESVKTIGTAAFYGCADLTEFKFNAVNMNDLNRGNYVFGEAAQNGDGLKVTIGKQVTRIPAYLFDPFSDSSFSLNVTSLEFEEGSACESIGRYAFQFCTGLESVDIPDGVTVIDSFAFYCCSDLASVSIPDSVLNIEWGAFGSDSIQSVTYCGTEEQWGNLLIRGQNTQLLSAARNYHQYENGSCAICGEADPNAAEKFDIDVSRMILGNSLEFQFGVSKDKIVDTTGLYAVVEKGETIKTIPASEWGSAGKYWAITYDDLAAKEMGDTISVTVYNAEGEAISNPKTDSVRDYVARAFDGQTDKGKTMMVDMLNYGAAAQLHFGYNTGDLANNKLTDAQKATGTSGDVTMNNNVVKGTNYTGSRFILQSRIQVQLAFKDLTTDMYAIYTYKDANGDEKSVRVEGEDFVVIGGKPAGVELSALVYADARAQVKVTVYKADGTIHGYAEDSIESCATRSSGDVFGYLMKFADSAKKHLYG